MCLIPCSKRLFRTVEVWGDWMRTLERNKVDFHYALYAGNQPILDDSGYQTGEYEISYGNPVSIQGNISAARGETVSRQFGEDIAYDKVIVLDDPASPIDEFSVLWIDTTPVIGQGGTTETPYDYIVKKVARSINSVSIAVSKVNVQ